MVVQQHHHLVPPFILVVNGFIFFADTLLRCGFLNPPLLKSKPLVRGKDYSFNDVGTNKIVSVEMY